VIELLAITDDPRAPEPPVRAVRAGELTVLCSPAAGERDLTPDALWRREALIEELMEERALLPVRYGTVVEDERAAAEAVAGRDAELAGRLERVRGAVELAVRAQPAEAEQAPAGGVKFIQTRRAAEDAARKLHERLAAAAREAVLQPGRELLRGAYLVPRDGVEDIVALVRALQEQRPELLLVCTGPWPPYSFSRGATP
jgi:hypothetical protein